MWEPFLFLQFARALLPCIFADGYGHRRADARCITGMNRQDTTPAGFAHRFLPTAAAIGHHSSRPFAHT